MNLLQRIVFSLSSNTEHTRTDTIGDSVVTNWGSSTDGGSASRISIVYGCVNLRAQSIASLPVKLTRYTANGRKPATDLPLYRILTGNPNPYQTTFGLIRWVVSQMDLHGNAFVQKIFNNRGEVVQLVPIQAQTVEVRIDTETGQPIYIVTTTEANTQATTTRLVPTYEIIHFKNFSFDGVRGVSTIQHFSRLFGHHTELDANGSDIAKNAAKPGNVIFYPGAIKDADLQALKDKWDNEYKAGGAGKTAWLPNTYKFETQQLGMSARDAMFIEQKQFSAARICADIFACPLHFFGLNSAPTYASVSQMNEHFLQHTLLPIIINIEQELTKALIDDPELEIAFDVAAFKRTDLPSRLSFYTFAMQNGAMTPNQMLELENIDYVVPEEKGGNTYSRPLHMGSTSENILKKET